MKEIEVHYRENYDRLVKIIRSRLDNNHHVAEECVQEAYARALQYYPKLKSNVENFDAWFRTILNNTSNEFRNNERNRGVSIDGFEEELTDGSDFDRHFSHLTKSLKEEVSKVTNKKHKYVLDLYFNKGLKVREIAMFTDEMTSRAIQKLVERFRSTFKEAHPDSGLV